MAPYRKLREQLGLLETRGKKVSRVRNIGGGWAVAVKLRELLYVIPQTLV